MARETVDPKTEESVEAFAISYWRGPDSFRKAILARCENDEIAARSLEQLVVGILLVDDVERILSKTEFRIPVPWTVWRQIGGSDWADNTWRRLQALGLLRSVVPYKDGSCREFGLDPSLVLELLGAAVAGMDGPWCNIVTGKPVRTGIARAKTKAKPKGRPKKIGRSPQNWIAGKAVAEALLKKAEIIGSRRHRARALQAVRCLLSIRESETFRHSREKKGFGSYEPVYSRDKEGNGRAHEIGGCFQCAPSILKAALDFDTGGKNYDLRGAQMFGFLALCGAINSFLHVAGLTSFIDPKSLDSIRELMLSEDGFSRIANAAGIPRATAKACIYSMIMGGGTSANTWKTTSGKTACGAVLQTLLDHFDDDFGRARKARKAFLAEVQAIETAKAGLFRVVEIFMREPRLLARFEGSKKLKLPRIMRFSQTDHRSRTFLENAVHCSLEITGFEEMGENERAAVVRRAVSHLLTGVEQDFISRLVRKIEESDSGCQVWNLEHDGIRVSCDIPAEIIAEAQDESLLKKDANLEIKPFVRPDEVDELDHILSEIADSGPYREEESSMPKHTWKERIEAKNAAANRSSIESVGDSSPDRNPIPIDSSREDRPGSPDDFPGLPAGVVPAGERNDGDPGGVAGGCGEDCGGDCDDDFDDEDEEDPVDCENAAEGFRALMFGDEGLGSPLTCADRGTWELCLAIAERCADVIEWPDFGDARRALQNPDPAEMEAVLDRIWRRHVHAMSQEEFRAFLRQQCPEVYA